MQHLAHVARRELVELLVVSEDDHCDIDVAEHRELVGFLEEAAFPLEERSVLRMSVSFVPWEDRGGVAYTERFLSSLIFLMSIFLRPILTAALWLRSRDIRCRVVLLSRG